MKPLVEVSPDVDINAIENQLEQIFKDPHFSEAEILKRFLRFIVHETIGGRSNCLKEYTIATRVLDKSTNFKPQENCIVRIHAGRLRRALERYYNGPGIGDDLIISIPKGKYIPEFIQREDLDRRKLNEQETLRHNIPEREEITVAVAPFLINDTNPLMTLFMNGLCVQLTNKLMEIKDISVISYQTIRGRAEHASDLHALQHAVGATHFVSGCIQISDELMRLNVQLFLARTGQMLWSVMFEEKLNRGNTFEVQDHIVNRAFKQFSPILHARPAKRILVKLPAAV